ncbi:MAG: archease [Thaumarchaeota archaeon]|nr:archease [Nitrososphaerota archaeon]
MSDRYHGFRFLEHTTDAEIEAFGKNLDEAFENAARAVEETMVDLETIDPIEEREIAVMGKDLETLLYSWIESLISLQEIEGMLVSKIECKVSEQGSGYELHARLRGEKFSPEKHEQKTAIKAPTFHDMKIIRSENAVTVRFLVDL